MTYLRMGFIDVFVNRSLGQSWNIGRTQPQEKKPPCCASGDESEGKRWSRLRPEERLWQWMISLHIRDDFPVAQPSAMQIVLPSPSPGVFIQK